MPKIDLKLGPKESQDPNDDLDLPFPKHGVIHLEEFFNIGCETISKKQKGKEGIVLVHDFGINLDKDVYYVIIFHDTGGIFICHYSQKFEQMIGAMVVYKKLEYALDAGRIEQLWQSLIKNSRTRSC